MADTAKRLSGPALLTNAAATQYTVPPATSAQLRDLWACNVTGSPATLFLSIGADAPETRLLSGQVVQAHGVFQITGNRSLAAGEIIQAYSGTDGAICLTLDGLETT